MPALPHNPLPHPLKGLIAAGTSRSVQSPVLRIPALDVSDAAELVFKAAAHALMPLLPTRVLARWMWNVTAWVVRLEAYELMPFNDHRELWDARLMEERQGLEERPLVVYRPDWGRPIVPGEMHGERLAYQALYAFRHFMHLLCSEGQLPLWDPTHGMLAEGSGRWAMPANIMVRMLTQLRVVNAGGPQGAHLQKLGVLLNRAFPVFDPMSVWTQSVAWCRAYAAKNVPFLGELGTARYDGNEWVEPSLFDLVAYHEGAAKKLGSAEEGSYDWRAMNQVLAELVYGAWRAGRKDVSPGPVRWRLAEARLCASTPEGIQSLGLDAHRRLNGERVPQGQTRPMLGFRRR